MDGAARNRELLQTAGYARHTEFDLWTHPLLDRSISANIAELMEERQLHAWIAEGTRRLGTLSAETSPPRRASESA